MATAPLSPTNSEISAVPPQTPPLSQGARIVNTFIAPSETFSDLKNGASWWMAYLLVAIVTTIFMWTIDRQVTFEQVSLNEIARSPKQAAQIDNLPPDQKAQRLKYSAVFTRGISYGVAIIIPLFYLIFVGIYMGIFNLAFNAQISFKTYWAIVVYAGLPGIIHAILAIVSLFAGVDPQGFNINNPVGTNPAYYMDPAGNKAFHVLATGLDPFIWWAIILRESGLHATAK